MVLSSLSQHYSNLLNTWIKHQKTLYYLYSNGVTLRWIFRSLKIEKRDLENTPKFYVLYIEMWLEKNTHQRFVEYQVSFVNKKSRSIYFVQWIRIIKRIHSSEQKNERDAYVRTFRISVAIHLWNKIFNYFMLDAWVSDEPFFYYAQGITATNHETNRLGQLIAFAYLYRYIYITC